MAPPSKIVFIVLDAGDLPLIDSLTAAGELPAFARLERSGARAKVVSPIAMGSDVMWFSFFTGVNPGRHGRYFVKQVRPGTYNAVKYRPEDARLPPFWNALTDAGHRVAVIDMPYAPMQRGFDGLQVVDWLVHNQLYDRPMSWPESRIDEIVAKYGADPEPECDLPERTAGQYLSLRDHLIERVRMKSAMICDTLAEGGWDLFMAGYADSHCVSHQCWHLHDPQHPLYDAAWVDRHGDPVKHVYREIDAGLGRILDTAGPKANVFVFAGPGMTRNYTANFLLDEILQRLEGGAAVRRASHVQRLRTLYHRLAPRAVRQRLMRLAAGGTETLEARTRASRKCFALMHNEISGAIRVNLVGREPEGKVRPGPEYDALFESLKKDFLEIVDLNTGRPLVNAVYRSDEFNSGDRLDELPDILVLWNRDAMVDAIGSPKIGEIRRPYPGNRTGDHTATSVMYFRGPDVGPAKLEGPVSILDFAPTMAGFFGIAPPNAEGRALPLFAGRAEAPALAK